MNDGFRIRIAQSLARALQDVVGNQPIPVVVFRLISELAHYRTGTHLDAMIDEAVFYNGRKGALKRMDEAGFHPADAERLVDSRIAEIEARPEDEECK